MEITRERIVARIEELKTQLEQLKSQHLAISGALADSEYWLLQLNAEEPPTKED